MILSEVRALLLAHGSLAEALASSAQSICALPSPLEAMSNEGLGRAQLAHEIREWLERRPGPAILFVDAGSGSCGIAARLAAADREDVAVLGGVNLPMVLTYLASASDLEFEELTSKLVTRARENVVRLDAGHRS